MSVATFAEQCYWCKEPLRALVIEFKTFGYAIERLDGSSDECKDNLHTRNALYWEFYNAIVLE